MNKRKSDNSVQINGLINPLAEFAPPSSGAFKMV